MQSPAEAIADLTEKLHINDEVNEFIRCLNNTEYDKAHKILDGKKIDWQLYRDLKTEDSLIHIAVRGYIEKIRKIYEPIVRLRSITGGVPGRAEEEKIALEFLELIKKMIKLGFPYHTLNKDRILPAEILTNTYISWSCLGDLTINLIKLFENSGQNLYPGRKYISDLKFFRSSRKNFKICHIPDADSESDKLDAASLTLHQRQSIYETMNFRSNREPQNLVVLNFGLLISDLPKSDPTHRPIFVTVPMKIENFIISATCNSNKMASSHSESLMCAHLYDEKNLKDIVANIRNKHPFKKGQKIYAVILDIHSTREICAGCEDELHELQMNYDDNSFLKKLERILNVDFGYILPSRPACDGVKGRLDNCPKLKVIIRASGLDDRSFNRNPQNFTNIPDPVYSVNPPRDIKTHPILTLFHLPPNKSLQMSTCYINSDDNEIMIEYRKNYRDKNYIPNIPMLFPKGFMRCQSYTAFSNTGGRAFDIRRSNDKIDHECDLEIIKRIFKI